MIAHLSLRIVASIFTLATVLAPTHPQARPAAAASAAIQMRHISIVTMGSGKPVVLIPGLSSPRAVWDDVAPTLAQTHRVILVQINGFAGDDPRGNLVPGVLDGVIADLHDYLTREKLTGAAIVGHSLGGLIAMKLAILHPADAGRLMIVDSLPFYGRLFGPTMTPAMLEPRAAAMRDAIKGRYGQAADVAGAEAVADQMALKPESRAKVKAYAVASDPRVTAQAMYEDLTVDLTPQLSRIGVPVTVVVPYHDALPQAQVDALYRSAYTGTPDLSMVEIGDAAHFVMLDQPQRFAAAMTVFLAK